MRFSLPLITSIGVSAMLNVSAADGPAVILQRAHAWELQRLSPERVDQVRSWIVAMDAEGRWPDIDLSARDRATWPPLSHISRLRHLAVASGEGGPLAGDDRATVALVRGLEAWRRHQPRSSNWWHHAPFRFAQHHRPGPSGARTAAA